MKRTNLPALAAPAAATTAASAAPAARPSATAAAISSATAARRLGPSLIHVKRPSVELGSIEMRDGCFGFVRIRHFHKSKPTRLSSAAVGHDIYTLYGPVLGEGRMQFVLCSLVAEVPDKNIGHENQSPLAKRSSLLVTLSSADGNGTQTQYQNAAKHSLSGGCDKDSFTLTYSA
jgi:hypothetical protein